MNDNIQSFAPNPIPPGLVAGSKQEFTIEAKIIRADGTEQYLGTIVGGNIFQKVASYLKIKYYNFKHKHSQKKCLI